MASFLPGFWKKPCRGGTVWYCVGLLSLFPLGSWVQIPSPALILYTTRFQSCMAHHSIGLRFFHRKKNKDLVDKIIYAISIVGPAMTIPQIYNIWIKKSLAGVSLATWLAFTIIAASWLTYGIAHRAKPIIFANILWLIVDIIIVTGLLVF